MYCISISYKNADVEFRRRFAFNSDIQREILAEASKSESISQCVLLCTCNRTEVYFCGNDYAQTEITDILSHFSGIPQSELPPHIMIFQSDSAITHLFKVVCGIDSMVVGEDEILGQTKCAYAFAQECGTVSYDLNVIFQSSFACAKRIKTQTALSKTSVSVATLVANEAAKLGESVDVLVIGSTGKIGLTVLKNLTSHKNINVIATQRRHNRELDFAEKSEIQTVDYNERYRYIDKADCIISATSSPHYTVTFYELKEYIKTDKRRLFIDLAVPPDIDREIIGINGTSLINIDYFGQLAKENNAIKRDSVEEAKAFIKEDIDTLKKDISFHEFLPMLEDLKGKFSGKLLEELLYTLKADISAESFSEVLNALKSFGG